MVVFCDKCKNIMLPKDGKLVCLSCGSEKEVENEQEFKVVKKEEKRQEVLVVEEEIQRLPRTRAECPKCGNMEAEWWLLQTRKADEGETRFFRCTKCRYTWREYQ